jgi:hypothetical protein
MTTSFGFDFRLTRCVTASTGANVVCRADGTSPAPGFSPHGETIALAPVSVIDASDHFRPLLAELR